MSEATIVRCEEAAKRIKRLAFDVIYQSKSHHLGSVTSCLDILAVLYFSVLRLDPSEPQKEERDWFVLSKGHAALAQYATLAVRGYFPEKVLDDLGKDGTTIGLHPDRHCLPGVEYTSGSLGHGLSVFSGAALAAKRDGKGNRFFVLLSDGECNEGTVWEAAMFAAHHGLDNLVAIVDKNDFQGFGATSEVIKMDSLAGKFEAFGWHAQEVDGHDIAKLVGSFETLPVGGKKPMVIIADTIKGKGVASLEDTLASHYSSLNEEQHRLALELLGC